MMATESYEFYRGSSIGDALMEQLDDLVTANQIPGDLAFKILHIFDRVISEVLASEVKATTTIKGKIKHYKQVDEVWTFNMKNARFLTKENGQKKDEVQELIAGNFVILACPAKKSGG